MARRGDGIYQRGGGGVMAAEQVTKLDAAERQLRAAIRSCYELLSELNATMRAVPGLSSTGPVA
jgi:hypothetical protein